MGQSFEANYASRVSDNSPIKTKRLGPKADYFQSSTMMEIRDNSPLKHNIKDSSVTKGTKEGKLLSVRRCTLAQAHTRNKSKSNFLVCHPDDGIHYISSSDEEIDHNAQTYLESDHNEEEFVRYDSSRNHRTSLDTQQEEYLRNKMRLQLYWQNQELIHIMENEIKQIRIKCYKYKYSVDMQASVDSSCEIQPAILEFSKDGLSIKINSILIKEKLDYTLEADPNEVEAKRKEHQQQKAQMMERINMTFESTLFDSFGDLPGLG